MDKTIKNHPIIGDLRISAKIDDMDHFGGQNSTLKLAQKPLFVILPLCRSRFWFSALWAGLSPSTDFFAA
ncbi:hypothetical protein [Ruegeria sp. HKCCA4812]|uniref:hypothetical protein n=1 Tax=Ruegeria sp. HKCCA4812 TaxID=2682993 RepID=UPI00148A0692|nr:hypothetical protein [Ruegeria sp. HKCCA4812]